MEREDFDEKTDKIAVVIKEFTLLKSADGFLQKYNEPYIVSFAIDEKGAANPAIDVNILPFPQVRKGDTVSFDGQGHLIYGPSNPGEFLAYSILFMESDQDLRELSQTIETILKSEAISIGIKSLLNTVPSYATTINVLSQLSTLVSNKMQEQKDDELFRRNGTLLRGVIPAYDILRTYTGKNDFIETKVSIIPLKESTELGNMCKRIEL